MEGSARCEIELCVRRARAEEHAAVATLWLRARAAAFPAIPPPRHDDAEVGAWMRDRVFAEEEVWVVERGAELIAMMALGETVLTQLYVAPEWTDRGLGTELLARAMRASALPLAMGVPGEHRSAALLRAPRFSRRRNDRRRQRGAGAGRPLRVAARGLRRASEASSGPCRAHTSRPKRTAYDNDAHYRG